MASLFRILTLVYCSCYIEIINADGLKNGRNHISELEKKKVENFVELKDLGLVKRAVPSNEIGGLNNNDPISTTSSSNTVGNVQTRENTAENVSDVITESVSSRPMPPPVDNTVQISNVSGATKIENGAEMNDTLSIVISTSAIEVSHITVTHLMVTNALPVNEQVYNIPSTEADTKTLRTSETVHVISKVEYPEIISPSPAVVNTAFVADALNSLHSTQSSQAESVMPSESSTMFSYSSSHDTFMSSELSSSIYSKTDSSVSLSSKLLTNLTETKVTFLKSTSMIGKQSSTSVSVESITPLLSSSSPTAEASVTVNPTEEIFPSESYIKTTSLSLLDISISGFSTTSLANDVLTSQTTLPLYPSYSSLSTGATLSAPPIFNDLTENDGPITNFPGTASLSSSLLASRSSLSSSSASSAIYSSTPQLSSVVTVKQSLFVTRTQQINSRVSEQSTLLETTNSFPTSITSRIMPTSSSTVNTSLTSVIPSTGPVTVKPISDVSNAIASSGLSVTPDSINFSTKTVTSNIQKHYTSTPKLVTDKLTSNLPENNTVTPGLITVDHTVNQEINNTTLEPDIQSTSEPNITFANKPIVNDSTPEPSPETSKPTTETNKQTAVSETHEPISKSKTSGTTAQPKTDEPTPEPKTDEPTPEPKTDQPTPEPKTDEPTPEPKTDEPTPEPKTDEPTPEPKTDEQTPEPKMDEPTTEPKTDEPTPEPTTDEPTPEPKTDEPTPEPKTDEPTPEPKTDEPTPEPKTSQPMPEPGSSHPPESEPETTSEPAPTYEPTSEPEKLEPEFDVFAEPGPDWVVAKPIWKEAWEFHVYFYGVAFALLGLYCFISMIRLWNMDHLLSRHYFLTLNILVIIVCLLRSTYLLVDAYNSLGTFPVIVDYFLYSTVFPCITAIFSILFYALLLATRIQIISRKVQKLWVLILIISLHFLLSFITDIVVGLFSTAGVLLFICQSVFILWGLVMFVGYLVIFRRLYSGAKNRQKSMHRSNQERKAAIAHGFHDKLPKLKYTLGLAVKITLISAFFGVACAGFELYGMFGVYGAFQNTKPEPWPWWTYHVILRMLELLMSASVAYVASQPLKYTYKKNKKHKFAYLFSCNLFCCHDELYHNEDSSSFSMDHYVVSETDHLGWLKKLKHKTEPFANAPYPPHTDEKYTDPDATLLVRKVKQPKPSMLVVEGGFVRIRGDDEMVPQQFEFDSYSQSSRSSGMNRFSPDYVNFVVSAGAHDINKFPNNGSNIHSDPQGDGEANVAFSDNLRQSDYQGYYNNYANDPDGTDDTDVDIAITESEQSDGRESPVGTMSSTSNNSANIFRPLSMIDLAASMESELERAFQSRYVENSDLISHNSLPASLEVMSSDSNECMYNERLYEKYGDDSSDSADNTSKLSDARLIRSPVRRCKSEGAKPNPKCKLFEKNKYFSLSDMEHVGKHDSSLSD